MSDEIKITKRDYNRAIKIVKTYEAQLAKALKKKRDTGYYNIIYLLNKDGHEDFRERLIKAASPQKAIEKFMNRAPTSLRWIDEEIKMKDRYYYIGDHPAVLNYLNP